MFSILFGQKRSGMSTRYAQPRPCLIRPKFKSRKSKRNIKKKQKHGTITKTKKKNTGEYMIKITTLSTNFSLKDYQLLSMTATVAGLDSTWKL